MKFALALLAFAATAQDVYETSETSTSSTYNTGDEIEHEFMENGQRVIGEYENVTTTTTTRHVDIPAPQGPTGCTDCVYSDMLLVVDEILIHEWALKIKADYDLLIRDWERSLEHFSFEIKALNEDYWVMFRPLVEARKEIHRRRHSEVITYVMNNTYFHGAHIHHVVPEVEAFLRNEFNPSTHNIVSMFNLNALTLSEYPLSEVDATIETEAQWQALADHPFTFDFNEQEVVEWFRSNQEAYDVVARKYQQDFDTFVNDVNVAVENFKAGEARVQGIYEQIVRNAAADAEFYWQMHFDSPLEDVTHVDINNDGSIAHL